ncbi:5-methylcytosine restriction system specificity protein McrC [Prevotella jejuni]
MRVVQLQEQLLEDTCLRQSECEAILPYMDDGAEVECTVRRDREEKELCLRLTRESDAVRATGSYFVGVDWIKEEEVAVQVSPKLNDGFEIDYVRMLNEALNETDNYKHLTDLLTIHFEKPSIRISQQQDLLSIFLITEYLNVLHRIVRKGLKRSYYRVEETLNNKVKGRIQVGRTIQRSLAKGRITDNVCRYQVYDIDSPANRILKKALAFCRKQVGVYRNALDTSVLERKIRQIKPYFERVSDEISVKSMRTFKGNPVFKEYYTAVEYAQLLLKRFSYDITLAGKKEIDTPPFWIDMSKLFELYVYSKLRAVFTGRKEVQYHVKAPHQELDYLLKPAKWTEPYVVDAKYKPRYGECEDIPIDDAREVSGYARLSWVYSELDLDADAVAPIKCLIIYPDQKQEERFTFSKTVEPQFEKVSGYVRFYKVGIKLPVIVSKNP